LDPWTWPSDSPLNPNHTVFSTLSPFKHPAYHLSLRELHHYSSNRFVGSTIWVPGTILSIKEQNTVLVLMAFTFHLPRCPQTWGSSVIPSSSPFTYRWTSSLVNPALIKSLKLVSHFADYSHHCVSVQGTASYLVYQSPVLPFPIHFTWWAAPFLNNTDMIKAIHLLKPSIAPSPHWRMKSKLLS
jgi:hypothetical protein